MKRTGAWAFVNRTPPPAEPVIWAILHGRSTQHAVQLEVVTYRLRFACMNDRAVNEERAMVRLVPWSQDEATLCKRHWCRSHWYEQTSLSDDERARMRGSLLEIEKELVEHGMLS